MDQDPDRRQELTVEITVDASAYRRKLAEAMESVTEEDIAAVANRIANLGPAAGEVARILDRFGYLWEVGIDPPPDPIPDPEIPAAVAYAGLAVALVLVALLAA